MADIYFTNTLTKKKEKFIPVNPPNVGIYSCGPTVYWNQHIGHMYAYVQWDILVRFLRQVGYNVKWVMNVTDVGHMTSDEDTGEDKMEKGASREGVSVWDLANKYIEQFFDSLKLLNVQKPDVVARATEHIPEQINLAKKIEENGFTYQTKTGLVYDTSKFADYPKFANLKLDDLKSTERQEADPEKKNPWDFFLWVTGNPKHIMQWDSPWGKGFPGWHIECTAMSTKYLGENFDIHTGGIEHIPVHHTNEIAQGYAAFGKQTANYWLHNAHLLGKGGIKMSKSLGNFVTAQELTEKGYDPLALRYLYLNSQYKTGLNFSFEALDNAANSLKSLKNIIRGLKAENSSRALSEEKLTKIDSYKEEFTAALSDDLNTPQALAVVWEAIKSNIPSEDKYELIMSFDEVLGLKLSEVKEDVTTIPENLIKLADERESARKAGDYSKSDELRRQIDKEGYTIDDTSDGYRLRKK